MADREKATNAIRESSQISQLLNSTHTEAASNLPSSFTSSPLSAGSASSVLPSEYSSGSSGSLESELHRRFPSVHGTITHFSPTPTWSGRGGPNSTQTVGRPLNDFSIKDIIIMGSQCEKTPTNPQEKVSLQRRNHVINRFTINKRWNEKPFRIK